MTELMKDLPVVGKKTEKELKTDEELKAEENQKFQEEEGKALDTYLKERKVKIVLGMNYNLGGITPIIVGFKKDNWE